MGSLLENPFELLTNYDLEESKLKKWMAAVAETYAEPDVITYHNWRHACDVFQFAFLSLHTGGASEYFTLKDILAVLLASVGHDVGHPGTNNAFQVNARTKTALIYNDKSVLESMHASLFFELAQAPDCAFLEDMDRRTYERL